MMRPDEWIAGIGREVRQAARALVTRPTYTLGALLSLSLGIGANVVTYSVMSAVMVHTYRYPQVGRLIALYEVRQSTPHGNVAPGSVVRLAQQATTLASIGAYGGWPVPGALTPLGGAARLVHGQAVTPGLFPTLEIKPLLGRLFLPEDAQRGRARVVVLREQMWRATFAADPHIIGRVISLDNTPYTVIGVIRDRDAYPAYTRDLWVPYPDSLMAGNFNTGNLRVVARLAPGATFEQARAQIAAIARQISAEHPNEWANARIEIAEMRANELSDLRPFILMLQGTVVLVLLIACANTANLTLARVIGRERELAVRAALGAGRWRIARTLLIESILLALIGGAFGVLLAMLGVPLIRDHLLAGYVAQGVAGWSDIAVNREVLLFAAGVSIVIGVLFGLGPALHAARVNLTGSLKEGGRGASGGVGGRRLRTALVMTQFILALVLTVGAALVTRSFVALLHASPGFQPEHVLALDIDVPEGGYPRGAATMQINDRIVSEVESLPGMRAAALTSFTPLTHNGNTTNFSVVGSAPIPDRDKPQAMEHVVTSGYFDVLGIRLLRGHLWPQSLSGSGTHFIVINKALADKYFRGRDPIGAVLNLGWGSAPIVGVVSNTKTSALEETESEFEVYEPMETAGWWHQYQLLARVAGDPAAATRMIQRQIGAIDPSIAVGATRTMDDIVTDYLSPWLLMVTLIGGFAIVALIIAGIGIYGVVNYSVSQRTHELGVRMALGARAGDVVRLVMRQSLMPMLIALPIALLGSWAVARLLSFLLYGVGALDVLTYATVSVFLLGVAAVACVIPARRAAEVSPSVSLRSE